MKISYMLKREDFYRINRDTLAAFCKKSDRDVKLFIYPQLNAIVTRRPSKEVKKYLYTEFRVNGSLLKRAAVFLYSRLLLNTLGLLSAKSVSMKIEMDKDVLIYPCNKKYRIFDFKEQTVRVVPKAGFPDNDIRREILFRSGNHADFIPPLCEFSDAEYSERIIDGYPLARAGARTGELTEKAWRLWSGYIGGFSEEVPLSEYAEELIRTARLMADELAEKGKRVDCEGLSILLEGLAARLCNAEDKVTVTLSHGDLQPGNIWVERESDRIYIIDWEAYGRRSSWYDYATLFEGIRTQSGIEEYCRNTDLKHTTVLLEDIIFRLQELRNLPLDYNTHNFNQYILMLSKEL